MSERLEGARAAVAIAAAPPPPAPGTYRPAATPAPAPAVASAASPSPPTALATKPPPPAPGAAKPLADQPTTVLPPTVNGGRAGNGGPPHAGRAWGRPAWPRIAFALAVIATALLGAWSTWQPQRSDAASQKALDEFSAGRFAAARVDANRAHDYDPLATKPPLTLAAIDQATGHPLLAHYELIKTVRRFPADPQVWLRLADFELTVLNNPAAALKTVRGALYLDPQNRQAQTIYFDAINKQHAPAP